MNKAKNWFNGLTTGGQVGAIMGGIFAFFMTVGIVGAAVSPPQSTAPSKSEETQSVQQAPEPKVETKTIKKTYAVAFKTVNRDDSSLEKGAKEVIQAGKEGVRTVTYKVIYTDGKETSREEVSNEVTTEPVNKVVAVGTYVAPEPAPASNCDSNYSGGCVPNVSYDLDCPDIGFSVTVVGYDPHGFDRDGDGYGCESY